MPAYCYLPKIAQNFYVKHVKADFAFYLLLAYNFHIIYTILSSLSKNHMIKLEIKKKNVWYDLLDGGGGTGGVGRS